MSKSLDDSTKRDLARAGAAGYRIVAGAFGGGFGQRQDNSWNYPPPATGRQTATRDWLVRAVQALSGFVGNDPEEAVYLNVSLGDRRGMKVAPDGSLTIYVQSEPPSEDRLANWLPAPIGDFFLFVRANIPGASVLDQSWQPLAITRLR
jgi:hypothetical protein